MKVVFGYLGSIILVSGLMLLIPFGVALFYSETLEATVFLFLAVLSVIAGFLIRLKFKVREVTLLEAMVVASISWLIVSFLGSLPYIFLGGMAWIDAYFEAMSGFTTTGMTLINNPENLSYSLLFWRAFTQWVGGVGIILLFILFIPLGI